MKKPDATDFLNEVLNDMDALPEGFAQELLDLVKSAPSQRREKILVMLSEVTSG